MTCHNCKTELDVEDTKVVEAAHDPNTMELRLDCPKCGHRHYTFYPVDDFVSDK